MINDIQIIVFLLLYSYYCIQFFNFFLSLEIDNYNLSSFSLICLMQQYSNITGRYAIYAKAGIKPTKKITVYGIASTTLCIFDNSSTRI